MFADFSFKIKPSDGQFPATVLCDPHPSTLGASQGQAMGSMRGTEAQPSQGPCPTTLNLPHSAVSLASLLPRYFEALQGAQEFLPAVDICFGN